MTLTPFTIPYGTANKLRNKNTSCQRLVTAERTAEMARTFIGTKTLPCRKCMGASGKSKHALGITKYQNDDCSDLPLDVGTACENCGEFYPYHKRHPMRLWLAHKVAAFQAGITPPSNQEQE